MSEAARHFIAAERAIRARGALRGDCPSDIDALVEGLRRQPDHALPDWRAHFEAEARIWAQACGVGREYQVQQPRRQRRPA